VRVISSALRTIAHISDLHFDRINPTIVDALLEDLHRVRPSLVAVSGDLTQRATVAQFEQARRFLAELPPPFVVVPGNHDIPGAWRPIRRFFRTLREYRQIISPELDQLYIDDELAVVALNSARSWNWRWKGFWKDGTISDAQLAWAAAQLADAPASATRIMVTHHPPAPPDPVHAGDCNVNAAALVRMLDKYSFDLCLSGHLHLSHITDLREHFPALQRPIWSVQASTATSTRLRGRANAYNVITIDGPSIDISIHEWKGQAFEPAQNLRFLRDPVSPETAAATPRSTP
jgi:3',5'-cyclic AMP phosphodiesterase CpdA